MVLSLLLPLPASEATAAITFVKNIGANASATSGTSIAVTVPSAIPIGNQVVLTVAFTAASGTVSVSDTSHGTYAVVADVTNASNVRTAILTVRVTSAYTAGQTITVTTPTATRRTLSANEFSGLAAVSPLDRTATATGNSVSPSSGATLATTQNSELLIGAIGVNGQASDTFTATGTLINALAAVQAVIAFRDDFNESAGSAVTSISLDSPDNTQLNDVMIATVTARSPNTTQQPTISTPAGWTAVPNCNTTDTSNNRLTTASFYRVATAADVTGATYTFNLGGPATARMVGGIVAYSGVDTANPIDVSNSASGTNAAPSITTTVPGAMLVGIWGHIGESSVTQPAGMTERIDEQGGSNTPQCGFETADQVVAAGATGTRSATGTNTPTTAQLIALRPSGTAITINPTYQIVTTTGTYSATGTLNVARQWAAAIATFKAAVVCGDAVVDGTEACDEGGANGSSISCCTVSCTLVAGGTECRAGNGTCDPAEACTGSSGACPADGFANPGTACGDPSDTDCTNPDTCDGNGACVVNDAGAGTSCGDPSDTECTNPDTCNGSGTCLVNDASAGSACGDPSDTECTNPDSCNGSGTCLVNDASAGSACGDPSDTECTNPDSCNGSGTCLVNDASAGSACGDPSDTECTNPDSCNGSGTCLVNDAGGGTSCGDGSDTDCTNPDTCNGSGACQDNHESSGFSCGDGSDTDCTNPDTCNGSGACQDNHESSGFSCGDGSDTDCTNPDTCNGSGTCQENHESSGFSCGDGSDTDCTNPDTCDGSGACEDNHEASGFSCGDGSDTDCTNPDTCDGSGACEANHEALGFTCGDGSDTDCTNPDTCDGSGACEDNHEASGFACGDPADTDCSNPDSCDGDGSCEDNHETAGTSCRPVNGDCDAAETCDGSGNCPVDGYLPNGTECRAPAGDCDVAEDCSGSSATCPTDAVKPAGTECRAALTCDIAEECDGNATACPPDVLAPDGTACEDGNACTTSDECTGGVCQGSGGACADAFMCHKSKTTGFVAIPGVSVDDALDGATTLDVKAHKHLCVPSDRDGTGIVDATTHLTGYKVKAAVPHVKQTGIAIQNAVGNLSLDTIRADLLLAPANVDPMTPPSAPDGSTHNVNHYKCYKAKVTPGTSPVPPGTTVTVANGYEALQTFVVKKPRRLCAPVDANGEGIENPDAYLVCYKIKAPVGQALYTEQVLQTSDQFGSLAARKLKQAEFCIPTVVGP